MNNELENHLYRITFLLALTALRSLDASVPWAVGGAVVTLAGCAVVDGIVKARKSSRNEA